MDTSERQSPRSELCYCAWKDVNVPGSERSRFRKQFATQRDSCGGIFEGNDLFRLHSAACREPSGALLLRLLLSDCLRV